MARATLLIPTLAALHERRSVRSYTAAQVERSAVEQLLEAAVLAPSAMNSQPWSFVVVQDADLLGRFEREAADLLLQDPPVDELAGLPADQLELLRGLVRGSGAGIFHGAPSLIVIYAADAHGVPDCFLAAENLMLAATALGLGTCPIGMAQPYFEQAAVKAELGVPPVARCALPIVLGEPSGHTAPTSRKPPEVVAWR